MSYTMIFEIRSIFFVCMYTSMFIYIKNLFKQTKNKFAFEILQFNSENISFYQMDQMPCIKEIAPSYLRSIKCNAIFR